MEFIKAIDKKRHLDLLLLADEQESMIDKYLSKGTLYVLNDNGIKGEIVVLDAGNDTLEIKNLAVVPAYQNQGYGRRLVNFVCERYKAHYSTVQVGTGNSPLTIPFYEKCGFVKSHVIKDFFIHNYDHPIIECGIQLIDMVYLKKQL